MAEAEFSGRYVALLAVGTFDLPAAVEKVSRLIADRDYAGVLGAVRNAQAVLEEAARLASLAIPEGVSR
jgi:hypothetical protein